MTPNPFNYIAVNLTNRCNTHCKYCFQTARPAEKDFLNFDNIVMILKFVMSKADLGQKRILHLTGGEPTMNRDFFRIVQYAVDNDFTVRIQTNGLAWSGFKEENLMLLNNPRVSLKVSLDGWNAPTHEFLRAPGTFNQIIESLTILHRYSSMIGIKTCIHEKNIDELYKMLDICRELKVQGFSYNMLRREGDALSEVDYQEFEIPERLVAEKLIPWFNRPEYQYLMNGNNLLLFYYTKGDIRYQYHFYIDYDGRVFPHQSCVPAECMGNVLEDGLNLKALDPQKAIRWCHYHTVDTDTVEYVKNHFIPIHKGN